MHTAKATVQAKHPKRSGGLYVHSTGRIARGTDANLLATGVGAVQNNPKNPFLIAGYFGECTWYAWEMRPDLGNRELHNASNWYGDAQKAGIPTGTVPVPGAIAVFAAWQAGAGSAGHVAYVESVSGGSMTVSEYNVVGVHRGPSRRTLAWSGVHFVYGGPAGNGPGSPPVPTPTPPPPPAPTPGPVNRFGITSYDQLRGGAPHAEWYQAWQNFTAASNTITQLSINVGNPDYAAGVPINANVTMRLCTDAACTNVLAQTSVQIVNYGATVADIGDVAVAPGATYYLRYDRPDASHKWVVYFWGPGTYVNQSASIRGYNR